jgi:Flp pilus assembly CpaF family ATPase
LSRECATRTRASSSNVWARYQDLQIGGHRFEGLLPPVVSAPTFSIRRRASRLIQLDDYVQKGIMTQSQAAMITQAFSRRLSIVVAVGTGRVMTTYQLLVTDFGLPAITLSAQSCFPK